MLLFSATRGAVDRLLVDGVFEEGFEVGLELHPGGFVDV
jgi:hypothetical protein